MKKLIVLLGFLLVSDGGFSQITNPKDNNSEVELKKPKGKKHLASGIFAGTTLVIGSAVFFNSDLNDLETVGNSILGCLGLAGLLFIAENKFYNQKLKLQVSGNSIGLAISIY